MSSPPHILIRPALGHSQPQPPPEWGPDRASQQSTGTTARSWFGSLTSMLAGMDPNIPLLLVSHVSKPQDWTPALLDAVHRHLQQSNTSSAMAAWASYNTVLEKAILTCNIPLILACLSEHRWHLCMDSDAPALLLATRQSCREILPLLLADARFGGEWFLPFIVNTAVAQYAGKDDCVLTSILENPSVDPWIVWQEALRIAGQSVRLPKVWVAGESELVDPEWEWKRSVALSTTTIPAVANTPRPCAPSGKLLIDLPDDIQFKLHQLLDAQSIGRIRSACRALISFPMDRFACQRLHFECYQSATLPKYHFNPDRIRSLLSEALASRHGSNTTCEELIGRILVESARHLTGPGYSLDLLAQLTDAIHPTTAAMYLTWTLHTLLTSAHSPTLATCTLLHHVLIHPHLPLAAWSLVPFNHDSATAILAHPTDPPPTAPDPIESIPALFLHLLTTRTLAAHWRPTPACFPDLFRAPGSPHVDAPSVECVQLLALATLAGAPDTLARVLAPPVVLDAMLKWIVLSHALAAGSPEHVRRVLDAVRPAGPAVRVALLDLCEPRTAGGESRRMRVVDVLFAYMSAEDLRGFVAQVKMAEAREVRRVRARCMWWWLRAADEGAGGWEGMASGIEREVKEWAKDEAAEGDVWVRELRERWSEVKRRRRRAGEKCIVQ